jgi:hypothetical protein
MTTSAVSAAARARAQRAADAIHAGEMEGLSVTAETRADADDYISGAISADELMARIKRRSSI